MLTTVWVLLAAQINFHSLHVITLCLFQIDFINCFKRFSIFIEHIEDWHRNLESLFTFVLEANLISCHPAMNMLSEYCILVLFLFQ